MLVLHWNTPCIQRWTCQVRAGYLLMRRINGYNPKDVAQEVVYALLPYKKNIKTITTDNGLEFREHKRICRSLGTTVYFTDAYSSWQKGTIENTNKLIRQYLPKGTDFNQISDTQITAIQYKINRRPRKKLDFMTPIQLFFRKL